MRPAARILAVAALATLPRLAMAALSVALSGGPSVVSPAQPFTVILQVQNTGSLTVNGVSPALSVMPSGPAPLLLAGPVPVSQSIATLGYAYFSWTYSAPASGSVGFTATAAGSDGAGTVSSSNSNLVQISIATPSPTPTATPVLTPTPTPWVIYSTPTPPPTQPNASIPGNLYHPLDGGQLQLRYDAPSEGRMQVDLYDRLGRHVKHFERNVLPGSYSELWDGRSDDGLLVSAGIYVAYFHGSGLSRTVKFAVIK